jgi:hypothetical protein
MKRQLHALSVGPLFGLAYVERIQALHRVHEIVQPCCFCGMRGVGRKVCCMIISHAWTALVKKQGLQAAHSVQGLEGQQEGAVFLFGHTHMHILYSSPHFLDRMRPYYQLRALLANCAQPSHIVTNS